MGAETANIDVDRFIKKYPVDKFQDVVINGTESLYINVKIIKNDKFMLKATNELVPYLESKVDKNGKLNVTIKADREYLHGTIMIFSPNLKGISFNNVSVEELAANTDSLNVEINRSINFNFSEGANIKNLNLIKHTPSSQKDVYITAIKLDKAKIENLQADLIKAYLTVSNSALHNITLKVKDAKAEFRNDPDKSFSPIENLNLNSIGANSVSFENIKINTANGAVSDETTIQIPTVNLKQLIK